MNHSFSRTEHQQRRKNVHRIQLVQDGCGCRRLLRRRHRRKRRRIPELVDSAFPVKLWKVPAVLPDRTKLRSNF